MQSYVTLREIKKITYSLSLRMKGVITKAPERPDEINPPPDSSP